MVIARLAEGATLDQAQEFFATEDFKGPPPIDFDLCFVNDRSGGPPHVIKAKMIQEVKVP